jgi:cytochrome c
MRCSIALVILVSMVNGFALADEKAAQKAKLDKAAEDDAKTLKLAELMEHGEKVYINNCVHCHQGWGQGLPPNTARGVTGVPALAGSKVATEH